MQVLMLCSGLGMAQLGVVALDGVEIGCDASMAANRTEEGLVKAAEEERDRQPRWAVSFAARSSDSA